MIRLHIGVVLLAAVAFGYTAGHNRPALGEDFRVENAVYISDRKEPSSESVTIFQEGVVYDCLKTPAETVVFDKTAGRLVLLNLKRKTRTELTTGKVADFTDHLKPLVAKNKDPLVRFLAEPKFQEHADEAAGELTLSSPRVSYRLLVLSHETNQNVVAEYREFCDWSARLNALLVPGSRPPFGRLMVNAAMARQQATPSQVLLTVNSGKAPKQQQTTVRSEHRMVRPLGPADLERVAQTREFMDSFKLVSFEEYRKAEPR